MSFVSLYIRMVMISLLLYVGTGYGLLIQSHFPLQPLNPLIARADMVNFFEDVERSMDISKTFDDSFFFDMPTLQGQAARIFSQPLTMEIDIRESSGKYTLTADVLNGITDKDDLHVTVRPGRLLEINVERKSKGIGEGEVYTKQERFYGNLSR